MPPEDIGAFEPASRYRRGRSAAALAAQAAHMQRLVARQAREIEVLKADHRLNLANLSRATDELDHTRRHERHRALVEAGAERDRLRVQLEAITHSLSWKITAPIRSFGKVSQAAIRRLRRAALYYRPERAMQAAATPSLQIPELAIDPRTGVPALPDPREAVAEPGRDEDRDIWPIDRPLVSVVITSFNYGRYLAQCVDSVLAQTFTDLELIVVEGGSTDGTSRQIAFALDRARVRVIAQATPHLAGANRNFGISRAQGKYICCLDADDLLAPTYIEKAVFLIEEYGYDVVSTSTQFFDGLDEFIPISEAPTLADMLEGNHLVVCAVFRRGLWEQAGGFRDADRDVTGHVHEDWMFWVRVAALGARMFNVNREALFLYRRHGASVTQTRNEHSDDIHLELILKANADVITPEALEASCRAAAEDRRPAVPLRNLIAHGPAGNRRPVLLLALPFTILGGAERLLSSITRYLADQGWQVIVLTSIDPGPEYGDTSSWFEEATKQIYHLPRFLAPERWEAFVRYLIASRRVDVLWIVGSAFAYDLLPALCADFPDLRIADLLFNTVGHTLNNRRHADCVALTFVESAEVRDFLLDAGEREERFALCPSGVDLDVLRPGPRDADVVRATGVQAEEIIVGFSGRWSEEKDPLAFIDIARCIPGSVPVRFVMTGAGPMRAAVEDALGRAALPPGRFHLAGVVADVVPWIRSFDVLVVPSRLDGRPVVAMEALALGVPVVASRVGALPELVQDDATGFLCAPGDVAGFAERITRLAEDCELLARMKVAARASAERALDARVMLRRYEDLLRGLVEAD